MGANLDKICPFAGILHCPPRDQCVPSEDAFSSPSKLIECKVNLSFELMHWTQSLAAMTLFRFQAIPVVTNTGCVCALDSGSIFSYMILGKLSVIKFCWPIPKVMNSPNMEWVRCGTRPGCHWDQKMSGRESWLWQHMNHQSCSSEEKTGKWGSVPFKPEDCLGLSFPWLVFNIGH